MEMLRFKYHLKVMQFVLNSEKRIHSIFDKIFIKHLNKCKKIESKWNDENDFQDIITKKQLIDRSIDMFYSRN